MKNREFYQDFLMCFPYDENEYPLVNIKIIKNLSNSQPYGTPYNLFDLSNGYIRYLSFKELHNNKNRTYWENLFKNVSHLDKVILVDDLIITNIEVAEMKDFYLKVYYWNILQYNKNVYIYQDKKC